MKNLEYLMDQRIPVVKREPVMTNDGKLIDIRCWNNLENYYKYSSAYSDCQRVDELHGKDICSRRFTADGVNMILSAANEEEAIKFALIVTKKSIETMMMEEDSYYSSYDEDEMYDEGVSIVVVDISKALDSSKNTYIELMNAAAAYTRNIMITGIGTSGISAQQMEAVKAARYCFHNSFILLDERRTDISMLSVLKMQFGFGTVWLEGKSDQYYADFVSELVEDAGEYVEADDVETMLGAEASDDKIAELYKKTIDELTYINCDDLPEQIGNIRKKCRGNITEEIVIRYLECGDELFGHYGRLRGMDRLAQMVGLSKVKDIGSKFMARAHEVRLNPKLSMGYQNMILVGEPGTGKSTVASIIAEIIDESGVGNGCFVRAETKDLIGQYVGQTAPRVADCFARARGGVLFVDEAGALLDNTEYTKEAVKEFVRYMEQYSDVTVMFAMYPEEARQFLKLDFGLASRIRHTVHFENYSNLELYRIIEGMLSDSGYTLPKGARKDIYAYIDSARAVAGRHFGNAREMRKLADEIVTELCLRHMRSGFDSFDSNIKHADIRRAVKNLVSQAEITKETKNVIGFSAVN